eukprot:TRINITY_DN121493_c0_g1_i1.p1 TRINITY_DN121493_c0_g1~~TRINITY_DN121493_c0_g1_i1.p1  ORF type:complete len:810 (-),score=215.92 TRINITY_DN121493_c0_g1_i1:219-2648(-)
MRRNALNRGAQSAEGETGGRQDAALDDDPGGGGFLGGDDIERLQEQVPRRAGIAGLDGIAAGFQDDTSKARGKRLGVWTAGVPPEEAVGREDIHAGRRKRFLNLLRDSERKPVAAEDLDNVLSYLDTRLKSDKHDLRLNISSMHETFKTEIEAVRETLDRLAIYTYEGMKHDAQQQKVFTATCAERLQAEIGMVGQTLEEKVYVSTANYFEEIELTREAERADREFLAEQVDLLRAEAASAQAVRWTSQSVMLKQQGLEIERQLSEGLAELRQSLEQQLRQASEAAAKALEAVESRLQAQASDTSTLEDKHYLSLCKRLDALEASLEAQATSSESKLVETQSVLEGKLADESAKCEESFQRVEEQTRSLHTTVCALETLPTRRVEWTLSGFDSALPEPKKTWLSPKFDVAGLRGLQLELRFLGPPADDEVLFTPKSMSTLPNLRKSAMFADAEDVAAPVSAADAVAAAAPAINLKEADPPSTPQRESIESPENPHSAEKSESSLSVKRAMRRQGTRGQTALSRQTTQGHTAPSIEFRSGDRPDGDLALALHCETEGFKIVCKLFIGGAVAQLAHSFDGNRPADTGRFCNLQDQLTMACSEPLTPVNLGCLRLAVELVEVQRKMTTLPRQLPLPGLRINAEPDGEPPAEQGSLVTLNYLYNWSLEVARQQEGALQAHVHSARVDKADVTAQFRRQQSAIESHAQQIVQMQTELQHGLQSKLDSKTFETRWETTISGEVRSEIERQQERLHVALDKEDQLIQLTEAIKVNLNTALALRGRGPPKLPSVTAPGTARKTKPSKSRPGTSGDSP